LRWYSTASKLFRWQVQTTITRIDTQNMNTRSRLPETPLGNKLCVYCGQVADTNDHAPPRCLLLPPLPCNLITLPACQVCNNGFSSHENVVRAFLALIGVHPHLVGEREPGGWLERTCERNPKLQAILESSRQPNGTYQFSGGLLESFERVFIKTTQGIFYGLYDRFVPAEQLKVIRIEDQRSIKPDEVIINIRPNPLIDITDQPLSEISPNSWHSREPIFILNLVPLSGGASTKRIFRLVRDTPVEWVHFQPGVFSSTFVKCDEGCACVFDLWQTLVITVKGPWPDNRGPLRRGRKNPMSRDKNKS
jgi:hypothetical protein